MPYIGQRPATGEANSFKILDDISNYTLTFGSSDIDVSADTITAREHRFVTGQRVTYGNGGGTDPTGLSNGTVYYIIVEDRHSFKLAANAGNAVAGTAIDITAAGAGAAHTINVAFDGVNTKFKATHTNGTKADISQSGQLMVSVNGVLQQPHDNTTTPTTGYATDHTSTIIFSAAPAAGDQFFGRLIASNFATFDISDNTVDNFTGDGNTSTFTLSKAPPNNESVLVTIDGVVQYPDDNAAVRAYTVSENVIDFASAPGNGVEIQVRHIGFAGASTGGISGFYGRTGNAVLKNTDDIVFRNANVGVVTATDIRVTGNLTVDGTTTTLDTELVGVDKLEVAANNTTAAGIITQTGSGDGLLVLGGNVGIGTDNPSQKLQVNGAMFMAGNGSGDGQTGIEIGFGSPGVGTAHHRIRTAGGTGKNLSFETQTAVTGGDVLFKTSGSERLRITSTGYVGINETTPTNRLHVKETNSNTIVGRLESSVAYSYLSIEDNSTTTGNVRVGAHGNDLVMNAGAVQRLRITSDGKVRVPDNGKFVAGDGDDLQIEHKSNGDSVIVESGTGALYIGGNEVRISPTYSTQFMGRFVSGAEVELYYNYSKKFETKSDGVDVTGELQSDSLDVGGSGNISGSLTIGSEINMMGTEGNKYIDCNLGSAALNIRGTSGGDANHEFLAKFIRNGPVELYYNNALKFATTTNGISVTGQIDIGTTSIYSTGDISMGDNDKLRLGGGDDLQIYHDGTDSWINNTEGDLYLRTTGSGDDIIIQSYDDIFLNPKGSNGIGGENGINILSDGAVELYYDNSKKLETTSDGITVYNNVDFSSSTGRIRWPEHANAASRAWDLIGEQGAYGRMELKYGGADGATPDEVSWRAIANQGVLLYYDNSQKLSTKSDGVDITGELSSDLLKVYSGNTGTVDIADFYASNNGSGGTNCRLKVRTYPNAGGDPFIFFDGGGTNFVVGEQWNGTTNNILRLGAGNDMSSVAGIDITAAGTILTNAATIDNTSSHGVIVAHAPASNADTGYKSIELGNSAGSGTSRGSTICGQPKSNSHPPYTLVGCWDDGSTAAVYYGGGFGSNMRPATTHRFYTSGSSYPTSNGSGTERLRIDPDGSIILGYGGGSLYFQNGFNDSNSRIQNGGGSNNSNLRFYTRSSGTEAERLRIQSDGNVIPASNDAYNLGLSGNRWNKVWTNYVRHGSRSATYEKTFTATSDGSGNLTFECGVLWLIDDSSFEVFCHLDRTGSYNNFAARYKFYGSKVSGFGTQGTYRSDTGTYYIISPVSNPTIDAYTPSGQGASHGTRIAHTGATANAEYRLTMLIKWVGQREVT